MYTYVAAGVVDVTQIQPEHVIPAKTHIDRPTLLINQRTNKFWWLVVGVNGDGGGRVREVENVKVISTAVIDKGLSLYTYDVYIYICI